MREAVIEKTRTWPKAFLLEEGFVDISKTAHKFNYTCDVLLTPELFKEIHPVAEEKQKGIHEGERIEDMVRLFKENINLNKDNYVEFHFTFDTYLKKYLSFDKMHMSKKRFDKEVRVFAALMIDPDKGRPFLLFGLSR